MEKRFINIITFAALAFAVSLQIKAQNPSVYEINRMSFNSNGFSNISPVIVKDGIIFCSDRRLSGIKDRTNFDGRRLYNIYIAEKKDTSGFTKPRVLKSDRNNKFNNGPLCIAPDGKTVYFTSEIETGKIAESKNFKNHSGIFIGDLNGDGIGSIRPLNTMIASIIRSAFNKQRRQISVLCIR